ncbi:MAG: glycosyltransferase family 2 protein [Patescibacteria group bacterium]
MNKMVGIILVNYKDYANKYLLACRNSLRAQNYQVDKFKVYIVDNSSSDSSFSFLVENYPEAKILARHDGNYCAANNLGFVEAIKDGCDYLIAANMDTEMDPNWLQELVYVLENNSELGIAQSKILLYPQNANEKLHPKINTLGNRLHFLGFGFTSGYGLPDAVIGGYPEIKGYASGCCFITTPEVFKNVGGWDENYYMYHDDIEFSLKVRLAGYKIILAPKSIIFHKYEFSRSVRMLYYMERNRYLLVFSFYPLRVLFLLLPAFIIMGSGLFVFALFKGWLGTWFKTLAYFFQVSSWREIKHARLNIKKISKLNFSDLAKDIEGRVDFPEIDNLFLKHFGNNILDLYWRLVRKII